MDLNKFRYLETFIEDMVYVKKYKLRTYIGDIDLMLNCGGHVVCDFNRQRLNALLEQTERRYHKICYIIKKFKYDHDSSNQRIFKDITPIIHMLRQTNDSYFNNLKFNLQIIFKKFSRSKKDALKNLEVIREITSYIEYQEEPTCNCKSCSSHIIHN